ncbi:MAG TPA: sodium:solute symporter family protein [Verrucomicrobiae bacterium]|nr:sodium:solute symporter family protein [Verrucomicrobiae bacterium]
MSTRLAIAIGLLLYAVLMLMVSLFWMARVKRAADYLVAGRGLPVWVLIGTIVGTCIGTGVIIGGSGLAYRHGWAGCAYPIGLGLGTTLTGFAFAGMRRFQFMTLSEEVACYYGGNRAVVEFANVTLFLSQLCWLTVQIMGGAAVLVAVTGLPHHICTVLSGFIKAMISIPGGLKSVVYTDVLQTLILFCGFGFLTYSALRTSGGLAGLRQGVPAEYFSFLGIDSLGGGKVLSILVALVLGVIADPGRRLTMYSARTETGAKWSMVVSGVLVMLFSVVIGITGMYTFHLNPKLNGPDDTLPWLVAKVLPPWLAGFVVVSVFSGMSSAANACATAAGTFFVRHIYPLVTGLYPRNPIAAVRWALVCAFILSTTLGLYTGTIVDFVLGFLPITMSGLAVIILVGRFWRRATWQGALAALVTTPLVSVTLKLAHFQLRLWNDPVVVATIAGFLAHFALSTLTAPTTRSFAEVAQSMANQRRAIEGEPMLHAARTFPAICQDDLEST